MLSSTESGRGQKIEKGVLRVALKDADESKSDKLSHTWTPFRTILRLVAGSLALVKVLFLVTDAEIAAEHLLIGLPDM